MDSVLILLSGEKQVNFDIADFSYSEDVRDALGEIFSEEELTHLEVLDRADFPDSIFKTLTEESWENIYHYYQGAKKFDHERCNALKSFYEEVGGYYGRLINDFDNRYSGTFKDAYAFGEDCAESQGIKLYGNDSFFDFEGFGDACAIDFMVLDEIHYFRN